MQPVLSAEGNQGDAHALAERFQLLIESVEDYAIFILDPEGNVQTWNPGAQRIKGYSEAEILGRHFSLFYPPGINPAEKLEIARRQGTFRDEGWRIRKGGDRFWAKVTITALRDHQGQLLGFAKVTQDLTARRAAEEDARRFRLLVESVKDYAIFILDPEGHITTWNSGAARIKGYESHEVIGRHFSIFYPPDAVAEGKARLELETAVREGKFEEEGFRVRKDGTQFWANVTLTTLRDVDGSLLGFAKVTQDLTQRREAEATRRALAEQHVALVEKARIQQFQERFLAVLGHDLRNPLASLDMGINILKRMGNEAAAERVLTRMQSSADRMTRMIEQILDLTRTRLAGSLELKMRRVNLQDPLRRIVEETRVAHPDRRLEMRDEPAYVMADSDRMEQVFSNLIGNAIAYGAFGAPVDVALQVSEQATIVSVHNTGEPIPPELLAKLFDPFRRGERDSRNEKTAGLGLGLYISQEIVHAHGGSIEVSSAPQDGTTFRIKLPNTPSSNG